MLGGGSTASSSSPRSRAGGWRRSSSPGSPASAGFQRFVAIKLLHPHLAEEQEFVEMFLDEARPRRRHPSPARRPHPRGRHQRLWLLPRDGVHRGGHPGAHRRPGALGRGARCRGRSCCGSCSTRSPGLHAAHELADSTGQLMQLVHRDCSPQNVLVGVDGCSRITDFGVARATARLSTTRADRLKGKIAYMPPEQAKGEMRGRPPRGRLRAGDRALGDARRPPPLQGRERGSDALARPDGQDPAPQQGRADRARGLRRGVREGPRARPLEALPERGRARGRARAGRARRGALDAQRGRRRLAARGRHLRAERARARHRRPARERPGLALAEQQRAEHHRDPSEGHPRPAIPYDRTIKMPMVDHDGSGDPRSVPAA